MLLKTISSIFAHKKTSRQTTRSLDFTGGEGGIRTHGPFDRTLDFESSTFDHSDTSPYCFLLAARTEELFHNCRALLCPYAGGYFQTVVKRRVLYNIKKRFHSSGFVVRTAVHQPIYSAHDKCPCAHGTRLYSNIKRSARQPPAV